MALTKTTSINELDAWQPVATQTLVVGNVGDISDSYDSLLYVESTVDSDADPMNVELIIEVSYTDDNWVKFVTLRGTSEEVGVTTINDADVNAGESVLTLTDANTKDFDIIGRKWFIEEPGTPANSESVRTKSVAGNAVTLCQDLLRDHTDGVAASDRVDEWVIELPVDASKVRVLARNITGTVNMYFTTRLSKVTALT